MLGCFPIFPAIFRSLTEGAPAGRSLPRKFEPGIRDKGMTALFKRKSHRPDSGRGDRALQLVADLGADRAVDRRMGALGLTVDHRRS